jgi:transposase
MAHVSGVSREQGALFPERLDDLIPSDSAVRVIDAFVAQLDLAALGFRHVEAVGRGRPPHDPADLLKLYVYGYMNRLRSSRELATACVRNIEVLWLLHRVAPCFKTIAAFRAQHPEGLRGVCRSFVLFARQAGLLTGQVVAVDGSKFQADNGLHRHYTKAQVTQELERLDRRIGAYLDGLDQADATETDDDTDGDGRGGDPESVERALEQLQQQRSEWQQLSEEMTATGESARAVTDPDSAKMRTGLGAWVIGYNVQLAVEPEHQLIVHHEVVNEANDRRQLAPLARATQAALGGGPLTVIADTGYAQAEAAQACEEAGITAIVPRQTPHSHWPGFPRERFVYDGHTDTYQCPAGESLRFVQEVRGQRRYRTSACQQCELKAECTIGQKRQVTRHRYEASLEAMDHRARSDPGWMRLRRATVEHPFGTLKRGQGARQFLTRRLSGARGEMALSVIAYNLKRAINVLGTAAMIEALRCASIRPRPA